MQLFPNSGATVGLDETMSAKKESFTLFLQLLVSD